MNTRFFSFTVMLLFLVLCFGLKTHAQPRNPQTDLSNLAWLEKVAGQWHVGGELQNKSVNRYPCVRMEINLHAAAGLGQTGHGPVISVATVELQNVLPNRTTKFSQPLTTPTVTVSRKSITDCSPPPETQSVVLYESPNFGGRSRSFPIGNYRFMSAQDFNDVASSIKVPEGLVAVVYEDADDGGGYGLFVDFLEDQPTLVPFQLNKKISYLKVFLKRPRSGLSWIRNTKENGVFKEGFWRESKFWPPVYPDPIVGTKPGNIKQPVPCTVSGDVQRNLATYKTTITLLRNGSPTPFSVTITGTKYTIPNVPAGTYEVKGSGKYPRGTLPNGMPSGLDIFAEGTRTLTCGSDGSFNAVNFEIRPIEG